MNKRKLTITAIVAIILIALVFVLFKSGITTFTKEAKVKPAPDPLDVTLDFYDSWLDMARGTSTNPYDSELMSSNVMSQSVKQQLLEKKSSNPELDPFYCQANIPSRIGGKLLYELEDKAEVIILDRTPSSTAAFSQAIVSLAKSDNAWQITNIACSSGETAPQSEFSFEKEGYLIKSMPAPYKSGEWHLVFEDNGVMGYVAPLFFNSSSTCITSDGSINTCDTTAFTEGMAAKVNGEMLEEGAVVVKLELK